MPAPALAPLTESELVDLAAQCADLREFVAKFRNDRGGVPEWFCVDVACAAQRIESAANLVGLKARKAGIVRP